MADRRSDQQIQLEGANVEFGFRQNSIRSEISVATDHLLETIGDPALGERLRYQLPEESSLELVGALDEIRAGVRLIRESSYRDLSLLHLRTLHHALLRVDERLRKVAGIGRNGETLTISSQIDLNEHLRAFRTLAAEFWEQTSPIMGVLALRNSLENPTRDLDRATKEAQDLIGSVAQTRFEVELALKSATELASKVGVSTYAEIFAESATKHRKAAWGWLAVTAIGAFLVARVLWQDVHQPVEVDEKVTSGTLTLIAAARIALYSLLVSVVLWCGRAYRAARHNQVVNEHRANALKSFNTFVQASNEPSVKDAVLLHAAQSIFLPQSTGFGGPDNDTSGPTNIIEILRSSTAAKS